MLDSGYRISDLKSIPVTGESCKFKNKIALDNTYFLGYAHTVYGITYNTNNYKIPLAAIRDDFKGYIGVESLVAPWSEQMKLWHGTWNNPVVHNKSYVWIWTEDYHAHEHYNPEKFADLENSYYVIKDAPFPFETGELHNREERGELPAVTCPDGTPASVNAIIKAADPYPESNKIVTKNYIDERLASKRFIEVATDFWVRDYDCAYVIRASELAKLDAENPVIKIHLPDSFNKKAIHNKLDFTLLIEGTESTKLRSTNWVSALTVNPSWEIYYKDELVKHAWLNDGNNVAPDITEDYLYGNARYCVFRFETATDKVIALPVEEVIDGTKVTTKYDASAETSIYIYCENLIYRSKGINTVNGFKGTSLDIASANNTVLVNTTLEGSLIKVDLATKIVGERGITVTPPSLSVNDEGIQDSYWKIGLENNSIIGDEYIYTTTGGETIEISLNHERFKINGSSHITINKPNADNPTEWEVALNTDKFKITGDEYISVNKTSDTEWELALTYEPSTPTPTPEPSPFKHKIHQISADETITLVESYEKTYWSNNASQNLTFDAAGLETNETIDVTLYLYTQNDMTITGDIKWAMRLDNGSPTFISNRLYAITFSYIP